MLTTLESKNPKRSPEFNALSKFDQDAISRLQSENNSLRRINAALQNRLELILRRAIARRMARRVSM